MYFITTKRMLEVCFSAHPNIQYRTIKFRIVLSETIISGNCISFCSVTSVIPCCSFAISHVTFFKNSNYDFLLSFPCNEALNLSPSQLTSPPRNLISGVAIYAFPILFTTPFLVSTANITACLFILSISLFSTSPFPLRYKLCL